MGPLCAIVLTSVEAHMLPAHEQGPGVQTVSAETWVTDDILQLLMCSMSESGTPVSTDKYCMW